MPAPTRYHSRLDQAESQVTAVTPGGIFGGRAASRVELRHAFTRPSRSGPSSFTRTLRGMAAPVEVVSDVYLSADGHSRRCRIWPGAFGDTLAATRRGDRPVQIIRDHNGAREIGSSLDGFFRLEETRLGLMIDVDQDTPRGSLLAGLVSRHPLECGSLSIGFEAIAYQDVVRDDGTVLREVFDLQLNEISIVQRGAFWRAGWRY